MSPNSHSPSLFYNKLGLLLFLVYLRLVFPTVVSVVVRFVVDPAIVKSSIYLKKEWNENLIWLVRDDMVDSEVAGPPD